MRKLDQHALIAMLKDLALELGRTPTRNEFREKYRTTQHEDVFGAFSVMVQAAGLDPLMKYKNYGNEIFERDIKEVLASHEPRPQAERISYTPTLVIGDTHFPFVHEKTLDFIYEFAQKNKPQRIIQMGDLYDMYAHSKFPKSLNVYGPEEEENLAVAGAKKMWDTLKSISPKAECIQILGNHDIRPVKRTAESLPSHEHIVVKHMKQIMTFDGVTTIHDHRQEYIVEGIEFLHGYRSKLGDHRDFAMMNAVCGHIHRGGVSYRRVKGQTLWELNAGFVGDPESKALGYTSQKIADYTLGFGWIDELGPRFIHL